MGTSPPESPRLRCARSGCGAGATIGSPAEMSVMSLASPGDAKISAIARRMLMSVAFVKLAGCAPENLSRRLGDLRPRLDDQPLLPSDRNLRAFLLRLSQPQQKNFPVHALAPPKSYDTSSGFGVNPCRRSLRLTIRAAHFALGCSKRRGRFGVKPDAPEPSKSLGSLEAAMVKSSSAAQRPQGRLRAKSGCTSSAWNDFPSNLSATRARCHSYSRLQRKTVPGRWPGTLSALPSFVVGGWGTCFRHCSRSEPPIAHTKELSTIASRSCSAVFLTACCPR